jgi:hypothetical protein
MAKTKHSQNEKKLRRELEILKSQLKAADTIVTPSISVSSGSSANAATISSISTNTTKNQKFDLPINHIKHDLSKTGLYAIFAVGLLAILTVTKFNIF